MSQLKNISGLAVVDMADFMNALILVIVEIANFLFEWLPDSPFRGPIDRFVESLGNDTLGLINYFLPIAEIAAFLSVWVSGVVIYYGATLLLRWIKAIA